MDRFALDGYAGEFDADEDGGLAAGVFDNLASMYSTTSQPFASTQAAVGSNVAAAPPTAAAPAPDSDSEDAAPPAPAAPVARTKSAGKRLSMSDAPVSARKRSVTPRERTLSMIREVVPKVGTVTIDGRNFLSLDQFMTKKATDGKVWLVWCDTLGPLYVQGLRTEKNRIKKRFGFVKPAPSGTVMCDTYVEALRIGPLQKAGGDDEKRALLMRMVDGLQEKMDDVDWSEYGPVVFSSGGRSAHRAPASAAAAHGNGVAAAASSDDTRGAAAGDDDDDDGDDQAGCESDGGGGASGPTSGRVQMDFSARDLLAVVSGVSMTLKVVEQYFRKRVNGRT